MEAFFRLLKSIVILLAYSFSSILYFFYKYITMQSFSLDFPLTLLLMMITSQLSIPAPAPSPLSLIFNEAYRGSLETPAFHQDFRWSHYWGLHRLVSDKTLFRHLSQSHLLTLLPSGANCWDLGISAIPRLGGKRSDV